VRHELHLAAKGLRALAIAVVPLVLIGALLGGTRGSVSALVGAGIVGANHAVAAASTAWSRTLGAGALAAGYAIFVVRMFAVFAALAVAAQAAWIHKPALALAFCAALAVALTVECLSFVRKSYVPAWRLSR
jgi:hypothetical protein